MPWIWWVVVDWTLPIEAMHTDEGQRCQVNLSAVRCIHGLLQLSVCGVALLNVFKMLQLLLSAVVTV